MPDEPLAVVDVVIDACSHLPMKERLIVLEMAWTVLAQRARDEALAIPNGFPVEQTRQLEQLAKMAALVQGHTPDIELERLIQEGDWEGAATYLQKLEADPDKGGA
jgi:hypothetical protein